MSFIFVLFTVFTAYAAPSPQAPQQAIEQLTPGLFEEIEVVAQAFIKEYSPRKYFFIGTGRSPHGLLAYIEARGLGDVRYIPMSNAKFHFESPDGVSLRTPEREKQMRDHFRKFLPTRAELKGRKVLIVDFSDTAAGSVTGFYYLIETYFEMGFDLSRLRGVGLNMLSKKEGKYWRTNKKRSQVTLHLDKFDLSRLSVQGRPSLSGDMMYGQPDGWLATFSPVGRFDTFTMEKTADYAEARPEYQILLDWLRRSHRAQCVKKSLTF